MTQKILNSFIAYEYLKYAEFHGDFIRGSNWK